VLLTLYLHDTCTGKLALGAGAVGAALRGAGRWSRLTWSHKCGERCLSVLFLGDGFSSGVAAMGV